MLGPGGHVDPDASEPRARKRGTLKERRRSTTRAGSDKTPAFYRWPPWTVSLSLLILAIDLTIMLPFFRKLMEEPEVPASEPVPLHFDPSDWPTEEDTPGVKDVAGPLDIWVLSDGGGTVRYAFEVANVGEEDLRRVLAALLPKLQLESPSQRIRIHLGDGVSREDAEPLVALVREFGATDTHLPWVGR